MQVSAGVVSTTQAVAADGDRLLIPYVLRVQNIQEGEPVPGQVKSFGVRVPGHNIEATTPRVAGRECAVEHVIAEARTAEDVLRMPDSERVHWILRGNQRPR